MIVDRDFFELIYETGKYFALFRGMPKSMSDRLLEQWMKWSGYPDNMDPRECPECGSLELSGVCQSAQCKSRLL